MLKKFTQIDNLNDKLDLLEKELKKKNEKQKMNYKEK